MTAAPPARKAVVCDDHLSLAQIIRHLLRRKGYSVRLACDGGEGLDALREEKPDLLLLDLGMPRVDGLAVLEQLPRLEKRPYTIVLSGRESREAREQATALGA